MIPWILTCLVALASMLLVSCYPYPEHPPRRANPGPRPRHAAAPQADPAAHLPERPPAPPTVASARLPSEAEHPAMEQPKQPSVQAPARERTPAPPRQDVPLAKKAPGRQGFVLSPYNNKLILVRGIPSGSILPDASYPASANKYFRVP